MPSRWIQDELRALFTPLQMGYRVSQGADAVVHAAREVVHALHDSETLIKLDKSNAFNSPHRNKMLELVCMTIPHLFPLVSVSYSTYSMSFWGTKQVKKVPSRVTPRVPCCSALLSSCREAGK